LLILYEGAFTDDGGFPRVVEFPVPRGIDVNQAAALTPDGRYLRQAYQIIPQDGFDLLRYELPLPTFFFEYYYNPFEGDKEKSFDWWLRTSYPIADLQFEVQRPLAASSFTISPAADSVSRGNDGFEYHFYSRSSVGVNDEIKLHVSYTKENPEPSVTRQPFVEPGAATSPPPVAAPAGNTFNPLVIGLGLLALALVGAGAFWYVKQQREEEEEDDVLLPPPRRPRRRRSPAAEGEVAAYCHSCGTALQAEDRFCPSCGTRRRLVE
jgi:hypothetical protein